MTYYLIRGNFAKSIPIWIMGSSLLYLDAEEGGSRLGLKNLNLGSDVT